MTDPQIIVDLKFDLKQRDDEIARLKEKLGLLKDDIVYLDHHDEFLNNDFKDLNLEQTKSYLDNKRICAAEAIGRHMFNTGAIKIEILDGRVGPYGCKTSILRASAKVVK